MNILIVDDEYYIVQGILHSIDWTELGIGNVYTAYSMKQAQEIFGQQEVDILLTDIEMPKGSGLDLISWVNDHSYHPVKLLLTGHQDFSYAQKAILLQCLQYIVKPVQTNALEAALMQAVSKARELQDLNRAKNITASWDSDKPLRLEAFWNGIFNRMILSEEDNIILAMHRFGVPLSWAKEDFYFLLFYIQPKKVSKEDRDQIPLDTISSMILGQFDSSFDNAFFKASPDEIILPVQASFFNEYQAAFHFCEMLCSKLSEGLPDYRFSIYLSDKISILHAADCYQLLKNFKSSTFATESIVIPAHALEIDKTHEFSDSLLKDLPLSKWSEYLLQYKSPQILKDVKAIFKTDSSYYPVRMLIALYYGVLQTIFSVLESKEISMNELFPKLARHTDFVRATSSIEEFLYWTEELLKDTQEILKVNSDSASFVESVKKFVRAHIDSEELNRNTIADAIHMNPDYLSYLFHKQSGMLLNTYITNERIQAAKKLLMTTNLPLQAIADATGFSNSSYFHKQFKKVTGVTPQQYRAAE
ncbi:MAG TPA: helix-turn-helix domain-containing protein [Clostridiales bacterium]|nr:helix-turn-helix domain-containing protein [Clostridiales bacterium]